MPSLWGRKKKKGGHYRESVAGLRQPRRKKWYHAFTANANKKVTWECEPKLAAARDGDHNPRSWHRNHDARRDDKPPRPIKNIENFEDEFSNWLGGHLDANGKTRGKDCSDASSNIDYSRRNTRNTQHARLNSDETEDYPVIVFKDTLPEQFNNVPAPTSMSRENEDHDLNLVDQTVGAVGPVEEDDSISVRAVRKDKPRRKQQRIHSQPSSEKALMDVLLSMGYNELQCRNAILALEATENAMQLENEQDETADVSPDRDLMVDTDTDTQPVFPSLHEASKPQLPPIKSSGKPDANEFKDRIKSIMDDIDMMNKKLTIHNCVTNSTVVNKVKIPTNDETAIDESDPYNPSEVDRLMHTAAEEESTKIRTKQHRNLKCHIPESYCAQAPHDGSIEVLLGGPIEPNTDSLNATRSEFNVMTELYALLTYFSSCGLNSIDLCTPEYSAIERRQHRRKKTSSKFVPPEIIEAGDLDSVGDLTLNTTWDRDISSVVQGGNEKFSNKVDKSSRRCTGEESDTLSNDMLSADVDEPIVFERTKSLPSINGTLTDYEDGGSCTELTVGENTVRSILEAKATLKHHASRLGVKSLLNGGSEATIRTLQFFQSEDVGDNDCITIGSDTKASIEDAKETLKDYAKTLGVKELMNDGEVSIKTIKSDDESDCSDDIFGVWDIVDDRNFCAGISSVMWEVEPRKKQRSTKRRKDASISKKSHDSTSIDSTSTEYFSADSDGKRKQSNHSGSRTV
mmetsp:Transcript_2787/g.4351  ORF Transcript_2787/g.4351 Transcript_2787/m.4351 type:complete len:742 (+) Transcript_2787:256-2481(+)|eukprot:CAMPEP_0196809762 /NCGR_PEP_ID=MMETSP1362-20130617/9639_1 /TAXON_ID=163516 /ORGANISM="Leptocylindrus danicus, Strain CCMP1856" /LENGTH=741 /DNA_ID=CAMNT_0042184533 /DNA_START=187 /DNA_END=2412 /DNA_ORIENTATION=+